MKCPIMMKVAARGDINNYREYDKKVRRGAAGGAWGGAAIAAAAGLGANIMAARKNPIMGLAKLPMMASSGVVGGLIGHSVGRKKALKKL